MKAYLRILSTGLSLLLCVVATALSVRSHVRSDVWYFTGGNGSRPAWAIAVVITQPDTLDVAWDSPPWSEWSHLLPAGWHLSGEPPFHEMDLGPVRFSLLGFGVGRANTQHWVRVPLSAVAAASSVPTLLALRRSRRRLRRGRCTSCGYDLTGNLSGACPECGTAHTTAVKA